jgi:hypothetical protein
MIVLLLFVMRGLDPRIHAEFALTKKRSRSTALHGLPGQARQ